jgi:hypothetical protein
LPVIILVPAMIVINSKANHKLLNMKWGEAIGHKGGKIARNN